MKKKLVCLDMDGTIYLGNTLFPRVKELFSYMKENDIKYVFLTNNSSKTKDQYVEKLASLGLTSTEDDFYTSIDATEKLLEEKGFKDIYVLGITAFKNELKRKYNVIEKYEKGKKCDAVIVAFDTELKYSELSDAGLFIQDGAKFYGVNCDFRCPIEDGYYIPDCGGICKALELCTGISPIFLGKPEPTMIEQVMKKYNVTKEETIMVGDRFYTDIQAGINAGVDTLAVLSGESIKEDFLSMKKQPTYIEESIASLFEILSK